MSDAALRVIPLGGSGEIGKNMIVIEYAGEALVIDSGIMFPSAEMHGVDQIIPDFRYLTDSGVKLHAILITHGHEDHIGSINYLIQACPAPIYATPFTCALIEPKLRSGRLNEKTTVQRIAPGDRLEFGPFIVEPFRVCHSIPDCVGFAIETPVGRVVHTGDFKMDPAPRDGAATDLDALRRYGDSGTLALLTDSTNAEKAGHTPRETLIDAAFDQIFAHAPGRIIVATFASLISRVQQTVDACQAHGRKLLTAGGSMSDNIRTAIALGHLSIPPDVLIHSDETARLPPEQIVIMATGSQGESTSALNRLALGRHPKFAIQTGDTVILSAHTIPGNEEFVGRMINNLSRRGATVIHDRMAQVHVSGHANQQDQHEMIALVRPRYFIPVHGELRHLIAHARVAELAGVPRSHISIVENGVILSFDSTGTLALAGRIPGGYIFVDGASVGDVTFEVIRERDQLARDGVVIVTVQIDEARSLTAFEFVARGYIPSAQVSTLRELARQVTIDSIRTYHPRSDRTLHAHLSQGLERAIHTVTRRRPPLFLTILDANSSDKLIEGDENAVSIS